MAVRSRISTRFFLKELARAFSSDPRTAGILTGYQIAKESFNLRHPLGTKRGVGESVRMINLRLTDRCNLRCHTCGQWGDNGYLLGRPVSELKAREVSLPAYRRFVDRIVEAGWSPIWYIWGGEPMLYPGVLDLLDYIRSRGMLVALVTNGTRVAENAARLVDICKIIYLSIDGHTPEVHNAQRPGAGSSHDNFREVHDSLVELSRLKRERGLTFPYLVPITCITQRNIATLTDVYRLTRDHADTHVFYLCWWIDEASADAHTADFSRRFGFEPTSHRGWIGDWKDFDHGLVIDRIEEMEDLYVGDPRCVPMLMPKLTTREDVRRYYTDHGEDFGYNQCVSIFMEMQIDANGDVSLCRDYHDYTIGNIKDDDIVTLWNNEKARRFRGSVSQEGIMPVCRRCCGLMGY